MIKYLSLVYKVTREFKINHLRKSVSCHPGLYNLSSNEGNCYLCSKMRGDARLTGKTVIAADVSQKLSNFLDLSPYLASSDRWNSLGRNQNSRTAISERYKMCFKFFPSSDLLSTVHRCFHSLSAN